MRSFDRFDRYSANIGEIMERLGIDAETAIEEEFGRNLASVIRACQLCPSGGRCSEWLARAPVAVHQAPAFCPYAERLELLADEHAVIPYRRHTVH
jgi:hypothetical protein